MSSSSLIRQQQADLTQHLYVLAASRLRQLVWLQGSATWAGVLANQLIDSLSLAHPKKTVTGLEITTQLPAASQAQAKKTSQTVQPLTNLKQITSNQARHYLGQEHNCLVFNAVNGLNPNALGALAGSLVAGGILILVTPTNWPSAPSPDSSSLSAWPLTFKQLSFRFASRLHRLLTAYQPACLIENQPINWPEFLQALAVKNELRADTQISQQTAKKELLAGALTGCQSQVVEKLLLRFGSSPSKNPNKKSQPVVITANRGRGKSAALGLFIHQLLTNPSYAAKKHLNIVITAPSPEAIKPLMQRLESLPAAALTQVKFYAPDALLAELPAASLLLIDEAAAIPVSLLKAMVSHYPYSVFTSTQAGYEGNGRGFALRFLSYLTANYPKLLQLELTQPIRWANGCQLEKLINQLLLLDAAMSQPAKVKAEELNKAVSFSWLNQDELAANEDLLEKVMALLVLAHYRTSPNNLRQLLDAPKQKLLVAWLNQQPVGLALVQEEGGFPADLAEQIYLGQRRPQGHLLAQSLAFHAGFAKAAEYNYWRVQRILVHPSLQALGLGSRLLAELEQKANQQPQLNFLASSFGATPELASFWFKAGYQPVRLGLTAGQASGEFTLQLIKPLAKQKLENLQASKQLAQDLSQRFSATFINSLGLNFNQLNPKLAWCLLKASPAKFNNSLTLADKQELTAFCEGNRPLILTHTALRTWLLNNLHLNNEPLLILLIQFCLQNKTPDVLQKHLGLKGKKEVESLVRSLLIDSSIQL